VDFAEFYRRSADECLRAVLVSVGDLDAAQGSHGLRTAAGAGKMSRGRGQRFRSVED